MEQYAREGMTRAYRIGNRGPVRFDEHGNVHREIVDAYWEHGCYVFENVLRDVEIEELRRDVNDLLAHAPIGPGETVDAEGSPAVGIDMKRNPYSFVKPLSDPVGGTSASHGRHQSNFQAQLNRTSALSCLWVVPGTHKLGKVDIRAMVEDNGGSDQLPDAIPLHCEPGDVTIVNRQTLHSSFANTSNDFRISMSWGFHRRNAVAGQRGHLMQSRDVLYDDDFIDKRASVVQVAIDARRQYYRDETPFVYQPLKEAADQYRWSPETFKRVIRDYNTRDIAI